MFFFSKAIEISSESLVVLTPPTTPQITENHSIMNEVSHKRTKIYSEEEESDSNEFLKLRTTCGMKSKILKYILYKLIVKFSIITFISLNYLQSKRCRLRKRLSESKSRLKLSL